MSLFFKEGLVQYVENLISAQIFGPTKLKREKDKTGQQMLSTISHVLLTSDPESQKMGEEFTKKQNENLYQMALRQLSKITSNMKPEGFINFVKQCYDLYPFGFISDEKALDLFQKSDEKALNSYNL